MGSFSVGSGVRPIKLIVDTVHKINGIVYKMYGLFCNGNGATVFVDNNGGSAGTIHDPNVSDIVLAGTEVYGIGVSGFLRYNRLGNPSVLVVKNSSITGNTLFFIDENTGYIGGNQGKVYRTDDGGSNWKDISVAGVNIRNMYFVSADTGYVVGDLGTMFYTQNGGVKFKPIKTGTSETITRVYFWDSRRGFFETKSAIFGTTDGGLNFTKYYAPFRYDCHDTGFVAGGQYVGATLAPNIHVFDPSFKNFYYAENQNIMIKNGSTINTGKLTIDNGGSGIDNFADAPSKSDVYPNPSKGNFSITFSEIQNNVQLEVYDILGNLVYRCPLNPKTTFVDFSDKSKTIYFYVLRQSGKEIGRGKFLVE